MKERDALKAMDMSGAAKPIYEKFEKNSRDSRFGTENLEKIDAGEKTIVDINSSIRARIKEIDRQSEIQKMCPKMLPKRTSVQDSKSEHQNANDEHERGR